MTINWKPKEGNLVILYDTLEVIKKTRCSPDGPIHFAFVIEEDKKK